MIKRLSSLCSVLLALICIVSVIAPVFASDVEMPRHRLGNTVNAGKDKGFAYNDPIDINDPHYGWDIGEFFVSGYTRIVDEKSDNPVFLKNVGDKVTLYFNLKQDINNLNGDDKLSISEDTNGYDQYFGIPKTNFKRGTLIIKHTNYQNDSAEPTIYTDFLAANAQTGADTVVELCEEGDYEVALDYEIRKKVMGIGILPSFTNYRIYFKFSVRNGNCMVYPYDVSTKSELTNSSITENGFYLDLALSRYLEIDIKKEVLKEGVEGLTEDVRFNKPAKDGEQFTEEGIYTITVHNKYTDQTTEKKIYVGSNDVLKAYVTTNLSISEIERLLAMGATVAEDGSIIPPPDSTAIETTETETTTSIQDETYGASNSGKIVVVVVGAACILALICVVIVFIIRKKKKINDGEENAR